MSNSRKLTCIVSFLILAILLFAFYQIIQSNKYNKSTARNIPIDLRPTITISTTPTMTPLPILNPSKTNSLPMNTQADELTFEMDKQIQAANNNQTDNWLTFSSKEEGIFHLTNEENFTFQYPASFKKDYASGGGNNFHDGTDATLYGSDYGIEISTSSWGGNTISALQKAQLMLEDIVNNKGFINCDLYDCNPKSFSITEKKLSENLAAAMLTGPTTDDRTMELYFIKLSNTKILNIMFIYKKPLDMKSRGEIDLILSTLKLIR